MRILDTIRLLNNYTSAANPPPPHRVRRMTAGLPALLAALILSGCDALIHSPVDYLLDHTAVVTVAGTEGRKASLAKASNLVDIVSGDSVIALKLDNSRNIPIKLSLDDPAVIMSSGTIACAVTQNGPKEALVTITGAALHDELSLTLRIRADGRDFDPYTFTVCCREYTVSFDINGHGDVSNLTIPPGPFTLFDTVTDPGSPLPPPSNPPFLGWYKADGITPWNFTADPDPTPVTEDTIIYAKWGDPVINALDPITDIAAPVHGGASTLIAPFTGTGYTGAFEWTSGLSSGTTGNYTDGIPAVATVTLTAAAGYTFTGTAIDAAAIQAVFSNGSPAAAITSNTGATLVFTLTYTTVYEVGGTGPAGGKIFYYDAAGFTVPASINGSGIDKTCYFLEAAPADIVDSAGNRATFAWAPGGGAHIDITGAAGDIGAGAANTAAIIAAGLAGSFTTPAAQACAGYNYGGKTDWFLPSLNELKEMYGERGAISGFTSTEYWSSSQKDSSFAYTLDFNTGSEGGGRYKDYAVYVRPIRAF